MTTNYQNKYVNNGLRVAQEGKNLETSSLEEDVVNSKYPIFKATKIIEYEHTFHDQILDAGVTNLFSIDHNAGYILGSYVIVKPEFMGAYRICPMMAYSFVDGSSEKIHYYVTSTKIQFYYSRTAPGAGSSLINPAPTDTVYKFKIYLFADQGAD